MEVKNRVEIKFEARSVNEGFARLAVASFMMDMNPTMDELQDVKTAVSEAVTNAIVHGFLMGNEVVEKEDVDKEIPLVKMQCERFNDLLVVTITDDGVGIENIEEARQPFFTTKPDLERSGMGFSFMETFMDEVFVQSKLGEGTSVTMKKYIGVSGGSEQ